MNTFKKFYNDPSYSLAISDIENIDPVLLENLTEIYTENIMNEGFRIDPDIQPDHTNIPLPVGGYMDEYSYKAYNLDKKLIEFKNRLMYYPSEYVLNSITMTTESEQYITLLKQNPDKLIATFKFIDNEKHLNLTGNFGSYLAKYVMDFIISSTLDSLQRNQSKTAGFFYSVRISEQKRIQFYNRIIKLILHKEPEFTQQKNNTLEVYYLT